MNASSDGMGQHPVPAVPAPATPTGAGAPATGAPAAAPRETFIHLPIFFGVLLLAAIGFVLFQSGGLGHRSVAEMADTVPIGQGVTGVRFEIESGTVNVAPGDERAAAYTLGVMRAADTAEDLARLEATAYALQVVPDLARPSILVLRGPRMPPNTTGLLGLVLNVRLPKELELEVVVTGSGHITVGDRVARMDIATGRGDLRFEHCQCAIKAVTGRGYVIADGHRGDLNIETLNGDMQVFARQPGKLLQLVTGRGTVQCEVPENLDFVLDARAEEGRIGSAFGLTSERVGTYGAVMVGQNGSGTTKVVLRTGKGHVAFRSKKFD